MAFPLDPKANTKVVMREYLPSYSISSANTKTEASRRGLKCNIENEGFSDTHPMKEDCITPLNLFIELTPRI
jgi:hypothetical protein